MALGLFVILFQPTNGSRNGSKQPLDPKIVEAIRSKTTNTHTLQSIVSVSMGVVAFVVLGHCFKLFPLTKEERLKNVCQKMSKLITDKCLACGKKSQVLSPLALDLESSSIVKFGRKPFKLVVTVRTRVFPRRQVTANSQISHNKFTGNSL